MNATSQQMAARRYRIERYLTEGGMGAIYVGKKLGPGGFEKEVVLKQLLPEYTSRPEFRDLFFREAKISATLDHANIVHTFDLVESDESLFIVMEYVRGADLRTICRRAKLRRRQIAPAAAIQVALEVLAGLGYAHARRDPNGASLGIIHRDVSPSNILCSAQGEVKLSDFGIAKASTHSSVFYRVRGKIGYMSPEQARNQSIDARTDLYSLAVCLYEALTAERLFVGDLSTPVDVIYGQPIAPPSEKRRGLPPALDDVMAQALAPRIDERFQDARSFAEALRQVAHRHGLLSSAPQLAEDLRELLGADPGRWLQEESVSFPVPETQKIQPKALEGKEASSIGVVEGSNLYVVSGGDVLSQNEQESEPPGPTPPAERQYDPSLPSLDIASLLSGDPKLDNTRKPPKPVANRAATSAESPFFIPIDEDEEEPTGALPPSGRRSASTLPAVGGASATSPPPPPPQAAFERRPSSPALASPFEDDDEEFRDFDDDDLLISATPGPDSPAVRGGPPRGAPYASPGHSAPPQAGQPHGSLPQATSPYAPRPAFLPLPARPALVQPQAPVSLRPPETIDFGSPPPELNPRRSGPPGLVVLVVLLAAAAGGAKLGQIATRDDLGALTESSQPKPKTKPTSAATRATAPASHSAPAQAP